MNDMNATDGRGVLADLAVTQGGFFDRRGLAVTGLVATVGAMAATSVTAAIARAVGVDFELPDGASESIPVSGVAMLTGIFSIVGLLIAAAFRRWSARPAELFVKAAVTLTAISLLPPFLTDANAATVTALILIHLVAATVMIPALARSLRA